MRIPAKIISEKEAGVKYIELSVVYFLKWRILIFEIKYSKKKKKERKKKNMQYIMIYLEY